MPAVVRAPSKGVANVAIRNTPQAIADKFTFGENNQPTIVDPLLNDLGGEAKQLWSINQSDLAAQTTVGDTPLVLDEGRLLVRVVAGDKLEITLADGAYDWLAENETRPVTFSYSIRMANGAISTSDVTIVISGTNDAAVVTGDDTGVVTEADGPVTIGGKLDVSDVDGPDSFQSQDETEGAHGIFSIGEDGRWTYTLTDESLKASDDPVVESFTVKTADGTEHTVEVTVQGTDDAATFDGDFAGAVKEDDSSQMSASGTVHVQDKDHDDTGFSTPGGTVSGAYGTWTLVNSGSSLSWTYVLDNSNPYVQALNEGDVLTDSLELSSLDGTGLPIFVTINGTNEPLPPPPPPPPSNLAPVVNADGVAEKIIVSSQTNNIQLPFAIFLANDTDPDGDALTIDGISGVTPGLAAASAGLSSFALGADYIQFSTTPSASGSQSFQIRVSDGNGGTAVSVVNVVVLSTLNANSDDVWSLQSYTPYTASWLDGQNADDRISGSVSLSGGMQRDWLIGNQGDDTLSGGSANDRLLGGNGADVFVFQSGFGTDVIEDFSRQGSNLDRLDLDVTLAQTVRTQVFFEGVESTRITSSSWESGDALILKGWTGALEAAWII